jgi:hypothetical protein
MNPPNDAPDNDQKAPVPNPHDLEFLRLSLESAEKEADRMWTRFNALLVTNGGLLAMMTTDLIRERDFRILLSFGGIGVCLLWLHTVRLSVFYEKRWFDGCSLILERNGWKDQFGGRFNPVQEKHRPVPGGSSAHCQYGVVLLCVVAWLLLSFWSFDSTNSSGVTNNTGTAASPK